MARTATSPLITADMRVVVLHGREQYLLAEHTRALADALRERFGEVDRFTFDGESADLVTILDELRSYALLGAHKLVILDGADRFLNPPGEDADDDGRKSRDNPRRRGLERYAGSPMAEATLLLRAETWRTGNLDKLIARAGGAVIECDPPGDVKAVRWCAGRCEKRYDAVVTHDAAERLVARIGPDLARLDAELAKLATYVGPGGTIDADIVDRLVATSRQEAAWMIQDAILTGRPDAALIKLRELVEVGRHDMVPLTWAAGDLCRKLHAAASLLRAGWRDADVARALRLWGASTGSVLAAARRAPPRVAADLLHACIVTDMRGKSGFGDQRRNLEGLAVLVADTVGGAGGRTGDRSGGGAGPA